MEQIYDRNGDPLAIVPVSERMLDILDTGEEMTIIYHTPQLLRDRLGNRSGNFVLYKMGGQIRVTDPKPFLEFVQIHAGVEAAQGS